MDNGSRILSDLVVYGKYSKYLYDLHRRESYDETVARNRDMHAERFPQHRAMIEDAFSLVFDKKCLPSMRSMQFAGGAVRKNHSRVYNCCFMPINHHAAFTEAMFLLLCGTGVGYSVQRHNIDQLPPIQTPGPARRYLIGDSIEGWADAVRHLMKAYLQGSPLPVFAYDDIRKQGERLSSGGKAPGPEPLRKSLDAAHRILADKPVGGRLTSLDCHDILCVLSEAVLSGGIRRSAMIALFDHDDELMLTCKNPENFEYPSAGYDGKNAQRMRANNSAVMMRSMSRDIFDHIWKTVSESGSGEPGVFWTNDLNWGTNPCIPATETVLTSQGVQSVENLIGVPFTAIVDGKPYDSTVVGFVKTGTKDVFKVSTTKGYELRATDNHLVRVADKCSRKKRYDVWKPVGSLKAGDLLVLHNHRGSQWDGAGTANEGWLIGNLLGDGTFDDDRAYLCYWNDEEACVGLSIANSTLSARSDFGSGRSSNGPYRWGSVDLRRRAEQFGVGRDKVIDVSRCEQGTSSAFHAGFLRGWFDADGSVQGTREKGISVRLTSIHRENLVVAQRMLLRQGIVSSIYARRPEGMRELPDGKGGSALYPCAQTWELVVAGDNLFTFQQVIGFAVPAKAEKLGKLLSGYVRKPNRERFVARVTSVEFESTQDVYDCTIPEVSAFDASGVYVHNCAEIALRPHQFCNLAEINASDIYDQDDFNHRAWATAVIGTLQASYTDFHYLRPIWRTVTEEDALLGIGMTGIASGRVLDLDMRQAAQVACDTNEWMARSIGINPAKRVTCVKPSGTTSLVLGCSSGVHAWHDLFYIRRVRLGLDEPVAQFLLMNHPELIEPSIEKPHREIVVAVPVAAPQQAITRHNESPFTVLERVKRIQEEWIAPGHREGANRHNVSCTVNIKPGEWGEVGDWMWANRDHYTGLSCFPFWEEDNTHVQAPFETISEDDYKRLSMLLGDVDLKNVVEDKDHTDHEQGAVACAGGACEVAYLSSAK